MNEINVNSGRKLLTTSLRERHAPRKPRKGVISDRRVSAEPSLAGAVNRIGRIAILAAVVMATGILIGVVIELADINARGRRFYITGPLFILISLGLAWAARRSLLPGRRLIDLALLYLIAGSLLLELSNTFAPWPESPSGVSWSGLLIVMIPAVIPFAAPRVFAAALAAAFTAPLSQLLAVVGGWREMPPIENVAYSFLPSLICVVIAVMLQRIVHDITRRARVSGLHMGAYELEERLGRGGMGEVWRAHHALLARPAAVKLIRPDALDVGDTANKELVARFTREARATAALRSPHSVELFDFGITEDGVFYYAMEYLDGLTLEELVKDHGPLVPARTVHILEQVCLSLADAHSIGLIHRDIKPANVFLCRLGIDVDFVKVLDFGLVKVLRWIEDDEVVGIGEVSLQGTIVGTPAFLAPEMARVAGEVDPRADIYMVGCLAYWLLAGTTVFTAPNSNKMMIEHLRTPPIPISQRSAFNVPPELEAIVMDCLEKSPDDRPGSAIELLDRLQALELEGWSEREARTWWNELSRSDAERKHREAQSGAQDDVATRPALPRAAP